jgi:hypothetical protein
MFSQSTILPSIKEAVDRLKRNSFDCTKSSSSKGNSSWSTSEQKSTPSAADFTLPVAESVHSNVYSESKEGIDDHPVAVVDNSMHTTSSIYPSHESSQDGMIDYIPVEWFSCIHGDEIDITVQMRSITMSSIPLIREFGNSAIMDLLLYQTPEFQHRITCEVVRKINKIYEQYCRNNPHFNGTCSIIGHSLGSVIAFDILSVQEVVKGQPVEMHHEATPGQILYESHNYASIAGMSRTTRELQLSFIPHSFFALGSPIGNNN